MNSLIFLVQWKRWRFSINRWVNATDTTTRAAISPNFGRCARSSNNAQGDSTYVTEINPFVPESGFKIVMPCVFEECPQRGKRDVPAPDAVAANLLHDQGNRAAVGTYHGKLRWMLTQMLDERALRQRGERRIRSPMAALLRRKCLEAIAGCDHQVGNTGEVPTSIRILGMANISGERGDAVLP